jgi:hypothetical protein
LLSAFSVLVMKFQLIVAAPTDAAANALQTPSATLLIVLLNMSSLPLRFLRQLS